MNKFPQDKQAKEICFNWADDFKAMGMMDDFLVWRAAGFAFDNGTLAEHSYIITRIKRSIKIKIETSKIAAILPSSVSKAMLEISREAKYLDALMTNTPG
jgi:hypothetical protein